MKIKKILLATMFMGMAGQAVSGGYVISFEAGMKDGFVDQVGPILNLQNKVYEECYDAGKPLIMYGKIYVNIDEAPPIRLNSNGNQASYEAYYDGWIDYELIVPNHNIISHNPESEDYCVDNNLAPRSRLFIGATDEVNAETSTKREYGKLYLTNDREFYGDQQDKVVFKAMRDTRIDESSDHAYRNRVTVTASPEKWSEDASPDFITSLYLDSLTFLSEANISVDQRHMRDKYPLQFNYSRYTSKGLKSVKFNADILKITNVEFTQDFDLSHVDCVDDVKRIYLHSDKYYCF